MRISLYSKQMYRVAAINPEHFQSFTVELKIKFLKKFFFPKPSQLSAEE